MLTVEPVIKEALSLVKKATHRATSSGVPTFPTGIFFNIMFFCSFDKACVIGLSINPGAIQLTVIPLEATSKASDLFIPIIPAFEAA